MAPSQDEPGRGENHAIQHATLIESSSKVQKADTVIFAPRPSPRPSPPRRSSTAKHKMAGDWKIEAIPMYNLKRGPSGIPEMKALKNIDVAFVCMNLPYTM